MNWALAAALAWGVLALPAGYLLGRRLRRDDERATAAAEQAVDARADAPAPAEPDADQPVERGTRSEHGT